MYPRSKITSQHQSSKFLRERKYKKIAITSFAVLSVAVFTIVVSQFTKVGFLTIKDVEVKGVDDNLSQDIKAVALESLKGNYLGLFSRSNTFIYPKDELVASVSSVSSRIMGVRIDRGSLDKLVVNIEQKSPAALICIDLPDIEDGDLKRDSFENCHMADEDGVIYESLSIASTSNTYYAPNFTMGTTTNSLSFFKDLQAFYNGVNTQNLHAEAMLIQDNGEYELYFSNPPSSVMSTSTDANDLAIIYFSERSDIKKQLSNLISFLAQMNRDARANGQVLLFDSIDLRYGSNVFYKFR